MDVVKGGARQFDVYLVDLDPTIGSEIQKTRPCVIISPDQMNKYIRTVIVAPLTSTIKDYPTRVPIVFKEREGQVALDQLRTIDKQRLKKFLGRISEMESQQALSMLREMFKEG